MPSRLVRFQPWPFQVSVEWCHSLGEVRLRNTALVKSVPGEIRS
jgi:hypothetical protein